ncbi:MAG: bifunctional molybdenum cofactor biosynthesis protein MoaC/MoaB [Bacteroidia bacterium]|nr:bifunctional molybdenum cofactor biosynthesis protein MoaC/MoaB [Bacteroidia bacterium]
MRDISHKSNTLRTAIACAELIMKPESVEMVRTNTGPKPDIPATARAAGYLAVKATPSAIPHCHPIPVEACKIDFEYLENLIKITVEVKTIYKTGCEVEAMHGASLAALTIYDMLKPVDKGVEIGRIYLERKQGGKTDFREKFPKGITAAVIVCSDTVSKGEKEDRAGKAIMAKLEPFEVDLREYQVIPDEAEVIRQKVLNLCEAGVELIITTGGTGLGPRDTTTEALAPLIEKDIPGIMEAARKYGQDRTPYAMLSRSVAGLRGRTLILTLPGSTRGAEESMDALFPYVLHIFKVLEKGYQHLPGQ